MVSPLIQGFPKGAAGGNTVGAGRAATNAFYAAKADANWYDVDATNLTIAITTRVNSVLLLFTAHVYSTGALHFDFTVDGARVSGVANGLSMNQQLAAHRIPLAVLWLTDTLEAGSHTFRIQWKLDAGLGHLRPLADHLNVLTAIEIASTSP